MPWRGGVQCGRDAVPDTGHRASLDRLIGDLRPDLPDWLALSARHKDDPQPALFASEAPAVARASASRRAEFTAGRAAARAALATLGLPDQAIPWAPDRAPVWPAGYCGSITHTGPLCLAVAAKLRDAASVGVDLELWGPMPGDTAAAVATPAECATLPDPPERAARRIFSAKEAAYKAQYRLSGTLFGFDTLCFTDDVSEGTKLHFTRDVPPFVTGDTISLRQWCAHDLILSLAILPAAPR